MKYALLNFRSLVILVSLLMLTGCGANKKATTQKSFKEDEFADFEGNSLKDPVSEITWTYHKDNPTTYFRYKLENTTYNSNLPTMEQLLNLLDKVSFQLNQRKDRGNIKLAKWFETDCNFLSSSFLKTNEGEILYEVVHWDAAAKKASKEMVTGGDLVTVLLINE